MRIKPTEGKSGAVILGGDFQGLGIARNLSQHGVPVAILDHNFCIGRFSRCTTRYFRSPPLADPESLVQFLLRLGEKEFRRWVLFPTSDAAVKILAVNRDALLPYYLVPTPPWEITQYAYDKRLTHRLATDAGIAVPKTLFPSCRAELDSMAMDFPVILKPSVIANFFPIAQKKALRANNRKELIERYDYMASIIDPSEIMIQELIEGGPKNLYSFCSLFADGEVKAKIMARRLRQHPMDFGSATTFAVTCDIPLLQEMATRFLQKMRYEGLSEVEFMFDEKEYRFKLLEMNARTWGWHTLGAKAGVNFSLLLFRHLHNQEVRVDSFESGVKWVRELTDIPTALKEFARRRLRIGDYLKSIKGRKELAVFSGSDPLPFLAELFLAPVMWYRREFRSKIWKL